MKSNVFSGHLSLPAIIATATFLCALPLSLSAHETHVYDINGAEYRIVIGSLNEPVIVDDKTGLDLRIFRNEEPLVGAQDSLQVEMIAGSATRVENIEPVHGAEGEYKTTFIATVPTTLQYRIFGELEGSAFDQTYTCNPVGHPASVENTERIELSEGVAQTLSRGNFGCPQPKEEFGFPEPAASSLSLTQDIAGIESSMPAPEVPGEGSQSSNLLPIAALALSVIALVLGLVAVFRRRESAGVTQ